MATNNKYSLMPPIQQLFRDKDTAFPLAAGEVYFFKDAARTVPKTVYQRTGSPPDYTYTPLPQPITLTNHGTYSDNTGNDILIYAYPYDASGNTELYYVVVKNSGGVEQFTRPGIPDVPAKQVAVTELVNFASNGQFVAHNDLPNEGLIPAQQFTAIAQGGWYFVRDISSAATDKVIFERIGSYVTIPTASPRYKLRIRCETPDAGDTYKHIQLRYRDVNKFASTRQPYTFSFVANSDASDVQAIVKLHKYYGSGGSSDDVEDLQTIVITPTEQVFNISFVFGDNAGKTIGENNDDYVALEVYFPTDTVFDVSLTNFVHTINDVEVNEFPPTPTFDFLNRGIAGFMTVPAYDGYDLHLPLRLTREGLVPDHRMVGKVYFSSLEEPEVGELLCNDTRYEVAAYSSDGIPYRRLYDKIKNPTTGLAKFGSGEGFSRISLDLSNKMRLHGNSFGAVSSVADGTNPTGFTFVDVQPGTPVQYYIANITTVSAASIPAGAWWTFYAPLGTPLQFYVWYKKDGVGTDPAVVGAKGILVEIAGAETDADVASKSMIAINSTYFRTPFINGRVIRAWDNGAGIDPDAGTRIDRGDGTTGDVIGTYQEDLIRDHEHAAYVNKTGDLGVANAIAGTDKGKPPFPFVYTDAVDIPTGAETRMKNIYLNPVIGY